MHTYELLARGVVTCYAYPVADACDEKLPFEVDLDWSYQGGREGLTIEELAESCIDELAIAKGWCSYAHPGGMRYGPQWYCPHHVEAILNVPDVAEDSEDPDDDRSQFARQLKEHLRPDPRRRKPRIT